MLRELSYMEISYNNIIALCSAIFLVCDACFACSALISIHFHFDFQFFMLRCWQPCRTPLSTRCFDYYCPLTRRRRRRHRSSKEISPCLSLSLFLTLVGFIICIAIESRVAFAAVRHAAVSTVIKSH